MTNVNWICTACRMSARREFTIPLCQGCGQPMKMLGVRWRVPKRKDKHAWKIAGRIQMGHELKFRYIKKIKD